MNIKKVITKAEAAEPMRKVVQEYIDTANSVFLDEVQIALIKRDKTIAALKAHYNKTFPFVPPIV